MGNSLAEEILSSHIPFVGYTYEFKLLIINDKVIFYDQTAGSHGFLYGVYHILKQLAEHEYTKELFVSMYPFTDISNRYYKVVKYPGINYSQEPVLGEDWADGVEDALYFDMEITPTHVLLHHLRGDFYVTLGNKSWGKDISITLTHLEAIIVFSELYAHREAIPEYTIFNEQTGRFEAFESSQKPKFHESEVIPNPLVYFQDGYVEYIKHALDTGKLSYVDLLRLGCFFTLYSLIIHFDKYSILRDCMDFLYVTKIPASMTWKTLVHAFVYTFFQECMHERMKPYLDRQMVDLFKSIQLSQDGLLSVLRVCK